MTAYELFLLFSGLFLMAVSVYLFVSSVVGSNTDADQLAWASGDEPIKSDSPLINMSRPLIHNFTLQHAAKVKSPNYRKSIEKKILTAGLSNELNVDEFIGMQILWGVMFPVFLFILNYALRLDLSPAVCLGLGVFGFYFPNLYCSGNKNRRYSSVIIDLPFYIELLALSMKAGLTFTDALQRIVDKANEKSVLANEFGIVLKDLTLGSSREDALRALATRLDIAEITSFVSVVIDADSSGASIFEVLQDQSEQMRVERFVRAEKAGARASQTIMIPMMIFILPAVFIMVFAPVLINFYYGGGS